MVLKLILQTFSKEDEKESKSELLFIPSQQSKFIKLQIIKSLIIKNSSNNNVSYINSTGDLCLTTNTCNNINQASCSSGGVINIKQSSGDIAVYINSSGYLCSTGNLYENSGTDSVETNYNLSYDLNGNLIQDNNNYYEYDDFNHLIRVRQSNSSGNITEEYLYDSNGQRLIKIEVMNSTNQTTYYIGDNFIHIVNSSGTFNQSFYYADGVLIAEKDISGNHKYYHPDHLGSTSLITNSSGSIVEETFYQPFGEILSGGSESRYDYEGKEEDSTGLNYFGARYYDNNLQLFTQPDSLLPDLYDPQQLNRYMFERGNPYKYVDESGNYIETAIDIGFIVYDIRQLQQDQSFENYLALAGDVGGALLPGVTGLGVGVRFGSKGLSNTDKIGSAAKIGEKISEANKLKQYEKSLKETGEVTVNSFGEANKLRESSFPGLQKVPGAGPSMTKASDNTFKGTNTYRNDYLFNKETGRVYGHGPTSPHGDRPHINIKEGKNKFTIIIDKVFGKLKNGKK